MNKIYLDQASTSFPKAPSVAQAVYDYLAGSAVNVNRGGYRAAYSVEEQIFETREQLLKLFHFTSGKGKNVIFTENITASLNVLLKGLLKPGDHVLVTAMEHNAVMRPLVQLEKHGITNEQLSFSKKAIWKIAHNYTKEAGVRQLEREIGNICRKAAKELLTTEKKKITVTDRNLHKFLGKEKYSYQMANAAPEVGIVRGLAWTSVGGDTLQIEVNVMPGKGEIMLTGQLGDVMKESARAGISYIRSVSKKYAIAEDFFEKHDIHVHIPEGAVPKDGPSAGITMATAMLSAVTGKKVRADLAMTGEITLRGRVLPIGGLKEKLLAAKNAGIQTVLIPKENTADVEELSSEITKGLEIIPVETMEEVLKKALTR